MGFDCLHYGKASPLHQAPASDSATVYGPLFQGPHFSAGQNLCHCVPRVPIMLIF